MLILSRRVDEKIRIGRDIVITVTALSAHRVKIGIDAPMGMPVIRDEIYEKYLDEHEGFEDEL